MRTTVTVAALMMLAISPLASQAPDARTSTSAARAYRLGVQMSTPEFDEIGVGLRYMNSLDRLLARRNINFVGTADYFFDSEAVDVGLNVAVNLRSSSLRPWVGGGLDLWMDTNGNGTTAGLNILGGLAFAPMGKVSPFVEGRFALFGAETLILTAGVMF